MASADPFISPHGNVVISSGATYCEVLPNLTRYLHHQLKLQKPILILPNFYDSESTNVEIKNELKAKPFRVIYTGTFNLANDVELILAAAERMQTLGDSIPTVEFVLIGKGVFTEKLRAIIKEKNLTRVHLIASVPKKELHHHLQAAHASVMIFRDLPIYQFGVSPNKLFDYMAHGLPVILAIAAHENPVSQAQCGIVIPPHNPKALVDAIVQLASMPQTSLEEMGLRGQRFVADYHCLAQFAQRLQAFIRQEVSMC